MDEVTGDVWGSVLRGFRDLVRDQSHVMDRLNLWPIPDQDTGKNMTRTLRAVVEAITPVSQGSPVATVAEAASRGAQAGGSGCSGQFLGLWMAGVARAWHSLNVVDEERLVSGLAAGFASVRRWPGVLHEEGSIVTVMRDMAAVTLADDLHVTVKAVFEAAKAAADRSYDVREVAPGLRSEDAGARGMVLLPWALHDAVSPC